MKLRCRFITLEDYQKICEWWKARGWKPVPKGLLPSTNVMVYDVDSGSLCAAAFLYIFKDVPGGIIEWTVTNPDNPAKISYKALNMAIDCICDQAKSEGLKALHTSAQKRSLCNILEKNGFEKNNEDMKHYIKGI